jgi:predicted P-loop ATPase/GTPase
MTLNQCQLFGNVAKLSQQINDNHYKYMSDWTFEQIFPYQQKKFQNIALAKDEARRMEELQTALDVIKKQADASAASAKIFDDALKTGNCAKLITFQK